MIKYYKCLLDTDPKTLRLLNPYYQVYIKYILKQASSFYYYYGGLNFAFLLFLPPGSTNNNCQHLSTQFAVEFEL
jgi:hypothetical protein